MVVISISAVPSEIQLVAGIPQYVTLSVNIPSVIFYTLDGTEPDTSSEVYTDSIEMPRDKSYVQLKAFATNGTDYSAVLSLVYETYIQDARKPHAKVTFLEPSSKSEPLIGVSYPSISATYDNASPMLAVDLAGVENVWEDGYDWQGNFGILKSDTIPTFDDTRLSDTDWQGNRGHGIGELPENEVVYLPPDPEASYTYSKTFNPRAMVLYADSREETDIPIIFRPYYWDVDTERNRTSAYYESFNSDGNRMISGSFIKQFYNYRDQTVTYYYRDSITNRWIISVEAAPRVPNDSQNTYLFNVYTPRSSGVGFVFQWVLFKGTGII